MKKSLFIVLCLYNLGAFSQLSVPKSVDLLKTALVKSKADTSRISLLLQVSNAYTAFADKTPKILDSALLYAQQAESLSLSLKQNTWLANSYLQKAVILSEQNNLKEGKLVAQKALGFFSKKGPAKKLADSYMALGDNTESYDSGLIDKIRFYRAASGIYRQENDKQDEASALRNLGEMLMYQGTMDEALEKLKFSLAIYDSLKYEKIQDLYCLLGSEYTQTGNYQQGLKYALLAVSTVEKFKDSSKTAGIIYNSLAVTYDKLGQTENTSIYLKKALAIAKNGDDIQLTVMLVCNIGHISLKLNNPREALSYLNGLVTKYPNILDLFALVEINSLYLMIYTGLKEYKNAGPYCAKVLKLSAKFPQSDPAQLSIYPHVINYYTQTKAFEKSLKYLELYKGLAEQQHFGFDRKLVQLLWFRLDSTSGNLSSAIGHYKLYKDFNDSLFNETESKQIAQLQVQFNTEKKDSDIVQLTREAGFQKKELHQAMLLKNLTLGGIVLLIIIITLLYNRYRTKQKSNYKLEKKQKEINEKNISLQHLLDEKQWLLKEIHHRVKNNLQIVMSLLNSQSVYLQDDAALSAIQDSQHRVHAMSLIHQKLYNTENTSSIDMPVYIRELVDYIRESFKSKQRIYFKIEVPPLFLDVCQAIPLGLILNEAITNAIKYAFPNDREGIITINLSSTRLHNYLLIISDNGTGIPLNFTQGKAGSLGISLIHGLSEDLDGNAVFENNNGTTLKISFQHDINVKRMDSVNLPEKQYA